MSLLPVGIGSAEAGGYQIERSLRFNSADSAYLNRTFSTPTDNKRWTLSFWMKPSALSRMNIFGYNGSTNEGAISLESGETLWINPRVGTVGGAGTNYFLQTTQVFRDVSAWYHIIYALDTTQATASNRVKLYVNGSQVTAFSTTNYPPQNSTPIMGSAVSHAIGRIGEPSYEYPFNGYLTEVNFIDGSALDPTSFGEFNTDTGVWQPKAYTGSYGTNGFYLNFSDNSGTTSTTLGKDSSGNGNNWTPNNFSVTAGAGNDSLVDTPTSYGTDTGAGGEVRGNYATLNAVQGSQGTLSNGNLDLVATATDWQSRASTISVSSGKWYWEVLINSGGDFQAIGIDQPSRLYSAGQYPGEINGGVAYNNVGNLYPNGGSTVVGWGASYTTGDVIGVALDLDTGDLEFFKNNVSQGVATTGLSGTYVPAFSVYTSGRSITVNFGQRPFAYTAPSGFKALCTQNLPEPTIVDGGQYFNTVLWTGDGASSRNITGVGFQPDWVWLKSRSNATVHRIFDSVRGATKTISSNLTDAESTEAQQLTAFISDGFSLGSDVGTNGSARTFVAWNWKANGSGVSNTDGTITSTVSANTDSGFSIVTFTNPSSGSGSIGHGLGVKPAMIIVKARSNTSNFTTAHQSLGAMASTWINMESTAAAQTSSNIWGGEPTSTVFYCGTGIQVAGATMVAYVFAPVAGYSAFGSYTGNGSTDGPFVFTNHRPAFLLIKCSSAGSTNWVMIDVARTTYNVGSGEYLLANDAGAEGTGINVDILSNGFKLRNTGSWANSSGATYIFMSLATNPFKISLAR